MSLRTSAKALIVHNGFLLAIKHHDAVGEWYSLPGGGQDPGETLEKALRRECQEELGVDVVVGALRFVREYIGSNHEFSTVDADVHQIELLFDCQLFQSIEGARPSNPDPRQVAPEWLSIAELPARRLYPSLLRTLLSQPPRADVPVYLGDVN